MAIIYNGVDIEDDVSVNSAVHEMNAGGMADTLDIVFEDEDHLWPKWNPKIGDTITYKDGGTSTGKMYVYDFNLEDNQASIYASNTPPYLKDVYSKTWEEVYLTQILQEVTPSYQLNGIEDVWYRYKVCSTKLVSFLNQTAELEGAILTVYDDKVLFVNEHALELQEPRFEVSCEGADVKMKDSQSTLFDACIVQSGVYMGSFRATDGERLYRPNRVIPCSSDAEAYRYAKALLRMANKNKTDIRWRGDLIPELSAGVTIDLINEDNPSWGGTKYCYRVRHDYGKRETTIYMRNPLEDY